MINPRAVLAPASLWLEQNRQRWLSIVVTCTVLAAGVFAGFKMAPGLLAQSRMAWLLLMVYMGLILLIVLLRWPPLGILLAVMSGLFVPFSGPGGLNTAQIMVAMLLGVWLLDMIARQRRLHLAPSRTTLPLFAFSISAVLSFLSGRLPWYSFADQAPTTAQAGGLAIFILSAGAFLLVANLVRDERWLNILVWMLILAAVPYLVGRLVPPIGNALRPFYQPGATRGSMFWTWLIVLSFSQAVLNRRLDMGWRVVLGGICLVSLYIALVQSFVWKSGWLPPLVGIAAVIGIRYWRVARYFIPLGLIVFYYLAMQSILSEDYSWGTRLDAWQIVVEIGKANPILGLGFGNYYWYTPLFPIRGWHVQFNSHNQYIDIFAQTGLLGLACYGWILAEVGLLGWRLSQRVRDDFTGAYVYGALGGLVATVFAGMLVDWVLPFVYNMGMNGFRASVLPWLYLGGLVSLDQIMRRQAQPEAAGMNPAKENEL